MNELTALADAIRGRLSKEDHRLLEEVYVPATEEHYDDALFDRVIERLKRDVEPQVEPTKRPQ